MLRYVKFYLCKLLKNFNPIIQFNTILYSLSLFPEPEFRYRKIFKILKINLLTIFPLFVLFRNNQIFNNSI